MTVDEKDGGGDRQCVHRAGFEPDPAGHSGLLLFEIIDCRGELYVVDPRPARLHPGL